MNKRQVAFVLFPGVHLMDLAGPAQVFYEAGQLGRFPVRIRYVSYKPSVKTAQELLFSDLELLESVALKAGDFLCIPGVDFELLKNSVLDDAAAAMKAWVREQRKKGVFVGSICSGALLLAKMGLLNGVRCTTHWKCMDMLQGEYPKAKMDPKRLYCFDRGIFTSAGMTSGIDMCLALVEEWANPLLAAKVAQEMVINVRRPDTSEQKNTFLNFKNHFNAEVYQAQAILASRLDTKYTLKDLAAELNMSSRHLVRLFKSHTGQTIHAYRNKLRLDLGEQLLEHSERSIKEIAVACGFEHVRQFIRIWKKAKGCTPGTSRNKIVPARE